MIEKNGAKWGDRVRICGISIDKDTQTVVNHVKTNKWESVEHFHRGGSTASEDYGAKGVPHMVLVDTQGKIVFIGHPAVRNLEKDIDELLEGKVISGEGTKAVGGEGSEEGEEGYEEMDLRVVDEEMKKMGDTFNQEMKESEEVKANC
jgi:hypothetical protein